MNLDERNDADRCKHFMAMPLRYLEQMAKHGDGLAAETLRYRQGLPVASAFMRLFRYENAIDPKAATAERRG